LAAFEGLVKKGDEVAAGRLRERIKEAEWLVFLFEKDRTLAGVAALKRPSDSYKRKVFLKAKSPEAAGDFIYEAGWIYVEEQFRCRGYSRLLLEAVLKGAGGQPVYATTREGNEYMRRTNRHCGLKESGSPYPSDEGDYNLVLYTRQYSR
jgi:GNAT superfamily N-acetyltransferase